MKTVSVIEAAQQLEKLIADALSGEAIFITDGNNCVQLTPCVSEETDIDFNSPELVAMLLEGLEGPAEPYSPEELAKACREAVRKRKKS